MLTKRRASSRSSCWWRIAGSFEEAITENLQKLHELKHPEVKQEHAHRTKVSQGDLSNFDAACLEIESFKPHESDVERLHLALDTLEELSHDIEFGVKLTSDKSHISESCQHCQWCF